MVLGENWLFISTPKCATHTMYAALPGRRILAGRGVWHGTPLHTLPNRMAKPHAREKGSIRERLADTHWTVVRNPYNRALSLWASMIKREDSQRRPGLVAHIARAGGDPRKPADFVRHVLLERPGFANPFLLMSQTEWQAQFICDTALHLEHLAADLRAKFGLDLHLPHLNTSNHADVHKTREFKSLVKLWAGSDFDRFDYGS